MTGWRPPSPVRTYEPVFNTACAGFGKLELFMASRHCHGGVRRFGAAAGEANLTFSESDRLVRMMGTRAPSTSPAASVAIERVSFR